MKDEKHNEIIREVIDEIESATKDTRGLVFHQRRLAFSLSLGAVNLLELYLHKHDILKVGLKIDHRWFSRKKERIIEEIEKRTTSKVTDLENFPKIINLMILIEEKRNELAYGSPVPEDLLRNKINLFFELRRLTKC